MRWTMMEARDIVLYLTELGAELKRRGIKKPVRVMVIGGAYMLLVANSSRPTEDVDYFWLDTDVLQSTFSQQEWDDIVESVKAVTDKFGLEPGWFNYHAQMLMIDDAVVPPPGKLWKRFG